MNVLGKKPSTDQTPQRIKRHVLMRFTATRTTSILVNLAIASTGLVGLMVAMGG